MHEFPITEQIVKICSKRCRDEGGSRVTKLKLVCGANAVTATVVRFACLMLLQDPPRPMGWKSRAWAGVLEI